MNVDRMKSVNQATSVKPWMLLTALIALADQGSKFLVQDLMPYGQFIPITPFFNLIHVWNTGAAFSFLADAGGWQRFFFIILALAVSIGLTVLLRKPLPRLEATGYSLILGGALGNVVDRIMRGYVVDYLDFHWRGWHWPAFNLADIGITLGATMVVIATLRSHRVET